MKSFQLLVSIISVVFIVGCSQKSPEPQKCPPDSSLLSKIKTLEKENKSLSSRLEYCKKHPKMVTFPQNAEVGKCYARVLLPSAYDHKSKRIMVQPSSKEIITIPPKYKWVEKKVLVKEATEKLVSTPPVYDIVTEKVLVTEAHKEWKKFTKEECMKDPIKCGLKNAKNINAFTGEVLCYVEVPDIYKTVTKKKLIKPAGVKKVHIPAVYKTVRIKKLIEPARTKTIEHPAIYETVNKKIKAGKEKLIWEEILCLKFLTDDFTRKLQTVLKEKGYYHGKIDGVYGRLTKNALIKYQLDNNLSSGALTIKTLESLGFKKEEYKKI